MSLAYIRRGSGPSLLLIHGIGSQHQMWAPVLDRLARERDVIAVDLPGFGDSPPLPHTPSVEALAAAVAEFLDGLGVERPHAAGNSLGGGVALEMARQGNARSVCVLSPAGFGTMREGRWARGLLLSSRRAAQRLDRHAELVMGGPVRRTLGWWLLAGRPWRVPADEAAGALRNLARSPGFEVTLEALREHRFGGHTFECPVTVAWGERDRLLIYGRQSARAKRLLPDATHVTLEGCGHVPTWDDPEQVARVLLEASAEPGEPSQDPRQADRAEVAAGVAGGAQSEPDAAPPPAGAAQAGPVRAE
jgi:pimeloyl-ACP methyl ester carboxylesterase